MVLMGLHNEEDPNSVRRCWILPRAGRAEVMYFAWAAEGLVLTDKPDDAQDEHGANARMMAAVQATFGREDVTFYRWRKWALDRRLVTQSGSNLYLARTGVKLATA